jgi:hypothetical protein
MDNRLKWAIVTVLIHGVLGYALIMEVAMPIPRHVQDRMTLINLAPERAPSHDGTFPGPDRRWSEAVIAWLDWQLKGDSNAAMVLNGLGRDSWSRIDATGL